MGLATPSLNRYKIAHTLLGSCTLCFKLFLECTKLPLPPPHPLKIKFPKNFSKIFFILMIFLKNLFKGVGLATLSLNRYNRAQGLLRRSCFKYINIMKKLPLLLPPHLKNSKFFLTISLEKKLPYLILRSEKFGSLVTSFFHIK